MVKSDFGSIGKGSIIVCPFLSYNSGEIHIGENVNIYAGCWLDCIKNYEGKEHNSKLEIGSGTSVGRGAHIITCGHMKIGKNVVLAENIYITDNLHGYDDIQKPILPQPLVNPGPVTIEDEVWIGERVCVMPNVTIGKHSVIGSNAVVTKDIPPYSVAVGIPAKVIRQYNFETGNWERVKFFK